MSHALVFAMQCGGDAGASARREQPCGGWVERHLPGRTLVTSERRAEAGGVESSSRAQQQRSVPECCMTCIAACLRALWPGKFTTNKFFSRVEPGFRVAGPTQFRP